MNDLKILFSGTPDFAVESLKILFENGYNICGVITAPDKPAGRGMQMQQSAVKKYAQSKGLLILQPEKLKDAAFLSQVASLKADLHIVVAFRMMPEQLWSMPRLGTLNLHASLLPQYRGAAPINRAIMNGETTTGVTTFFLKHEIDTGDIILSDKVDIGTTEIAGELHDRLMHIGAALVLKTVQQIEKGNLSTTPQNSIASTIKHAPKIFKNDCIINWSDKTSTVFNQIRGLSPYPGAFTLLEDKNGKTLTLKIYIASVVENKELLEAGKIISDNKSFLNLATSDGVISIKELQLEGKKRMNVEDFLRGFSINDYTVKK
ncbi:MAG TPA: methionyl-tRNA formyltransferase [Bacteroidia bacterium]|nr:methionyl-tRNA formyltransferase [Bacteroidia bacterium]QQR94347.1 MAG: methionyl-tRNA formyltransferase [Bacteroidota bacterium]MBP7714641.1 methionyl-tRNA formyltransferase [Bacteroidia bacterium]HOZ82753.1 methionyl-tRNA formyltransferase [Bacteroidia bacterium]HQW16986.1 methionyl-tRNA formyltransferase [Bacteroidia bacterium]